MEVLFILFLASSYLGTDVRRGCQWCVQQSSGCLAEKSREGKATSASGCPWPRVLPWGLGEGVLSVLFAEWVQKVLCMALPLWYHSAACF